MKFFLLSLAVVFLGAGCVSRVASPSATSPANEVPVSPPAAEVQVPTSTVPVITPQAEEPQRVEIQMSQNGFSPAQIAIKKGGVVVFRNVGANAMWPASDPHPTHTDYQRFDARRRVASNETYEISFSDSGVYTFHDHMSPGLRGRVVVGE